MEKYTNIKNYLLNHVNVIDEIVNDINCLDGSLEFLEYWENDEEFFNTFFNNPMDAVRCSFYGNYKFYDKYVKFDGYYNLSSFNEYELEGEYKDFIDDIVNSLLEHHEEINISSELNKLIKLIEEVNE